MYGRQKTFTLIAAAFGTLSLLLPLAAGTARAGAITSRSLAGALPAGSPVVFATHTQLVSANGISAAGVACPAGALPVGGGATVQSPGIEHVAQAGFHTSAAAGKFDGYQAQVKVGGLRRGAKVRFAVQVACAPSAGIFVAYVVRNQALSANGATWWGVPCPAGTLPAGGGTTVQNPGIEHVDQAGFHASTPAGKADGYEASVRVGGLRRGAKVRFTVEVACIRAVTGFVVYAIHTQILSADGTSGWGVACPAGTLPVGGGTAVANPLAESVAQAGFHTAARTGKFDGYQASVQVSGLPRGSVAVFAVQAACVPAGPAPLFGPRANTVSVNR
jgi:hypothetical protein